MKDLGFLRFCDDPTITCCQYEKKYFELMDQVKKLEAEVADKQKYLAENNKLVNVVIAARKLSNAISVIDDFHPYIDECIRELDKELAKVR